MKAKYLRMLAGMPAEAVPDAPREWSVYILRCADGTLYTGIAKDVVARVEKHNAGRGAAYTRIRGPATLVHCEPGYTRSEALIREARIKRLPRDKKAQIFEAK